MPEQSAYGGANEYDDARTHNTVNELLTRDTDSTPGTTGNNYTLTYNDRGDMTFNGQNHRFIYDAFGRLRKITNNNHSPVLIEATTAYFWTHSYLTSGPNVECWLDWRTWRIIQPC